MILIVHVEGLEGARNLKEILAVKGLRMIFVGSYDLSCFCRLIGQVNYPSVVRKMEETAKFSCEANIGVGSFLTILKMVRNG